MAHGDCDFGAFTLEQLIGSTVTQNAVTGVFYIRTVSTTVDCGTLTDAITCGSNMSWEDLIRKAIVIDDCSGKPAFNLALCSCP